MVEKLITHLDMTAPEQLRRAAAVKALELVRLLDPAGVAAHLLRSTLEVSSGRRQELQAAHRFYETLGFHDSAASSIRYWKHLQ